MESGEISKNKENCENYKKKSWYNDLNKYLKLVIPKNKHNFNDLSIYRRPSLQKLNFWIVKHDALG